MKYTHKTHIKYTHKVHTLTSRCKMYSCGYICITWHTFWRYKKYFSPQERYFSGH